ncbi:Radial spoke head protein 4 A [Allomyces arbusculus]|nr:Radial spoke head protein 4 A [Allomyces arbusculus]
MEDVNQAKQYLQQHSDRTGINLYDHLTELLAQVLEKRPRNPADVFENISSQVKRDRFNLESIQSPLGYKKKPEPNPSLGQVNKLMTVFMNVKRSEDGNDDAAGQVPDILELSGLFEWAGVSFGKEETFLLALSIHQLVQETGLQSARFWGKLSARQGAYYVVEAEGAPPVEDDPEKAAADKAAVEPAKPPPMDVPEFEGFPDIKKPVDMSLPKEEGTGVNKYTYFVCKSIGEVWTRLPDLLPEHVTAARAIRKYLTGNLSTPIASYPLFPGTEAHYLRAQIARITAATVVCPLGYYTFDPESADEEHPETNTAIIVNTEYEVLPNDALLSLENWVHQIPHVLPQGRTTWVNPVKPRGEGDDEDADREDGEGGDDDDDASGDATGGASEREVEPETGPTLLTSITEDAEFAGHPAWSVRACSRLQSSKFSPVHLRSNRWPGAHAVYYNGKFACVYVGDGLKDLGGEPTPMPALPPLQVEFKDEALVELVDPSVKDEKAFEEMLKEKEDDAQPDEEEDGEEEPAD